MPSSAVEGVKVISPVKDELSGVLVVVEDLNVVVKHVPWHVDWVETISPGVEGWGPEVHSEGLVLLHELDGGIGGRDVADLNAVDGPADVLWGPGHLVGVPIGAWLEVVGVVVALELVVAVSVDNIH